ncbi:MAG: archaeoflavoprotein AfpA [Canidatus Methanoxibalbensis ujae]|nr:archaeoflavoprotein AfpA [Candidatus Methanoxibalbensis ujae]
MEVSERRLKRVAWGITGSGDRILETVDVMNALREEYEDRVDISVYLSKSGLQVLKYYRIENDLRNRFGRKMHVERDANSPFLAGQLQSGKFEFLIIAPATANTVAKLVVGIADTLITNAALMALKAFVPVYIMPSDYREGITVTRIPSGEELKIRVRKEDAENAKKLASMEGVTLIEKPEDIRNVFERHFG